ncbi:MAG TPA: hypothetical protein VGO07_02530 [Candidatus Saccharimonadales bacterium]|jgi:hypothetical protein|nr:hypothetical protein [Candidatus Saccharimonadales bacterium]
MTPVTEDQLQVILDERFDAFEVKIEQQFAAFFGKMTRYIDKRFDEELAPIRRDIHHIYKVLDYLMKRAETEEQEHIIMYGQLDRHDGWIKELAASTGTRLSKT